MLSETGTIGAVLGTGWAPPVVAFKEGYEGGALHQSGHQSDFNLPPWRYGCGVY